MRSLIVIVSDFEQQATLLLPERAHSPAGRVAAVARGLTRSLPSLLPSDSSRVLANFRSANFLDEIILNKYFDLKLPNNCQVNVVY